MSTLQVSIVLAAFAVLVSCAVDGSHKTTLSVGYLTAIKGEVKERQGLAISGAITMALEEINNDPNILPNVHLELRWNDTRGDTVISTRAITEMVSHSIDFLSKNFPKLNFRLQICDGVATIFGPEGSCYVEAIVTQSRNIPMFAYVSRPQAVRDNSFLHSRLFIEMFRLQSICDPNLRANRASRHSGKLNQPFPPAQVVNQSIDSRLGDQVGDVASQLLRLEQILDHLRGGMGEGGRRAE